MTAARAVLPAHSLAHVARGVGGQDDGAVWMRVAGSAFVRAAAARRAPVAPSLFPGRRRAEGYRKPTKLGSHPLVRPGLCCTAW